MKQPRVTVTTEVAGIVYPDVETLTDDLFNHAFSPDHVDGADYKYGRLRGVVSTLDMQWLASQGEETDPSARTRAYLNQVREQALQDLQTSESVYYDRHQLPELFGTASVGTPYDYSDIGIHAHADGVMLTMLGGGHAGNSELIQLAQEKTTEDEPTYVALGRVSAKFSFLEYGEKADAVEVPIKAIAETAVVAAAALDLGETDEIMSELQPLWTPRTHFMTGGPYKQLEIVYDHPTTSPHGEYPSTGYSRKVSISTGYGLRSYDGETRKRLVDETVDGVQHVKVSYRTNPFHRVNGDSGIVQYGVVSDAPGDHFVETQLNPHFTPAELSPVNNKRLKEAAAILKAFKSE